MQFLLQQAEGVQSKDNRTVSWDADSSERSPLQQGRSARGVGRGSLNGGGGDDSDDDDNVSISSCESDDDQDEEEVQEVVGKEEGGGSSAVVTAHNKSKPGSINSALGSAVKKRASVIKRSTGVQDESINRVAVSGVDSIQDYLLANETDSISVHDMIFAQDDIDNVLATLSTDNVINHVTNIDFKGCKLDEDIISRLMNIISTISEKYTDQEKLKKGGHHSITSLSSYKQSNANKNEISYPITFLQLRDNRAEQEGSLAIGM